MIIINRHLKNSSNGKDKKGRFIGGFLQKTRANTRGAIPWNKGLRNSTIPPSRKGCIPWNKGKKGSQTAWNKGKRGIYSEETRKKISEGNKGKVVSLETRKKLSQSKKGENAPCWRGGITPLRKQIRSSLEYHLWRNACFHRDDFTCQDCKIRGGTLIVDHIKQFALILSEHKITSLDEALSCEELWDINNGRTLCQECHLKTDTYSKRDFNKNILV